MSRTFQSGRPRVAYRLLYWEDVVEAAPRRYGPTVFTSRVLDELVDLMGEKHPIHKNDRFAQSTGRKRRIVPGGLIQSFTTGWIVEHSIPAAVVDLRSATWDFVRPLYPDEPFFFTNTTISSSEIDDRLGLVNTERRVFDETDQVYAIGRMNVVMQRRPAGTSRAAARDQSPPGKSDNKGKKRKDT
jgi:acyl dehydratase